MHHYLTLTLHCPILFTFGPQCELLHPEWFDSNQLNINTPFFLFILYNFTVFIKTPELIVHPVICGQDRLDSRQRSSPCPLFVLFGSCNQLQKNFSTTPFIIEGGVWRTVLFDLYTPMYPTILETLGPKEVIYAHLYTFWNPLVPVATRKAPQGTPWKHLILEILASLQVVH